MRWSWESTAHFPFEPKANQEQVSHQGSPDLVQLGGGLFNPLTAFRFIYLLDFEAPPLFKAENAVVARQIPEGFNGRITDSVV
jgi:hypothetical protein